MTDKLCVRWGDIVLVDLGEAIGSEQGGVRPALVTQNDKGNTFAPTTLIAPITSSETKHKLPTHITVTPEYTGLKTTSTVLFEQTRVIDKTRIIKKIGKVDADLISCICQAIIINFGIDKEALVGV